MTCFICTEWLSEETPGDVWGSCLQLYKQKSATCTHVGTNYGEWLRAEGKSNQESIATTHKLTPTEAAHHFVNTCGPEHPPALSQPHSSQQSSKGNRGRNRAQGPFPGVTSERDGGWTQVRSRPFPGFDIRETDSGPRWGQGSYPSSVPWKHMKQGHYLLELPIYKTVGCNQQVSNF